MLCTAAAVPSFVIAAKLGYDPAGMLLGVALYVLLYTAGTGTHRFARAFRQSTAIRWTLYAGYGLRLLLLVVGIAVPVLFAADVFPGTVSVKFVDRLSNACALDRRGFAASFLTTVVQGALLNAMLTAVMCLLFPFIWSITPDKPKPRSR